MWYFWWKFYQASVENYIVNLNYRSGPSTFSPRITQTPPVQVNIPQEASAQILLGKWTSLYFRHVQPSTCLWNHYEQLVSFKHTFLFRSFACYMISIDIYSNQYTQLSSSVADPGFGQGEGPQFWSTRSCRRSGAEWGERSEYI